MLKLFQPKGSIPLVEDCDVRNCSDPLIDKPNCLELWHPSLDAYFASADTAEEVCSIETCVLDVSDWCPVH